MNGAQIATSAIVVFSAIFVVVAPLGMIYVNTKVYPVLGFVSGALIVASFAALLLCGIWGW